MRIAKPGFSDSAPGTRSAEQAGTESPGLPSPGLTRFGESLSSVGAQCSIGNLPTDVRHEHYLRHVPSVALLSTVRGDEFCVTVF